MPQRPKKCNQLATKLQKNLTFSLNFLGTVQKFNVVNVDQTKHFNHIHYSTYIDKIVNHHGRENVPAQILGNKFQADIQMTKGCDNPKKVFNLQKIMGFN